MTFICVYIYTVYICQTGNGPHLGPALARFSFLALEQSSTAVGDGPAYDTACKGTHEGVISHSF